MAGLTWLKRKPDSPSFARQRDPDGGGGGQRRQHRGRGHPGGEHEQRAAGIEALANQRIDVLIHALDAAGAAAREADQ